MKIDLHCHTKQYKSGDSKKRNVDKKTFNEKINLAGVEIVAITNHNGFDKKQYESFLSQDYQVWPGIELDVQGDTSYGHVIVIVNPKEVEPFSKKIIELIGDDYNNFKMSINELVEFTNSFDSIVICHYGKKPCLDDLDINTISSQISSNLFLEPSNLTSAGIFLAHNKHSLLGSDVKDWSKYEEYSFPELKMGVDSFEHFKLLIKKDKEVIKTFINKKNKEKLEIAPFEDKKDKIKMDIYNDVNIIIGGKGCGKTKILKELENYYNTKQSDCVSSYYANEQSIKYESIIKRELVESDFSIFNCCNMKEEFENIKNWKIPSVESTSKYYQWILNRKSAGKFGFFESSFNELINAENYINEHNRIKKSYESIESIFKIEIQNYLNNEDSRVLTNLLKKLLSSQRDRVILEFCKYNALKLEKFTIDKMKELYQIKKGNSSKPSSTGLLSLYANCKMVHDKASKISSLLYSSDKKIHKIIGQLPNKGFVYLSSYLTLNPQKTKFIVYNKKNVTYLREVAKILKSIVGNVFDGSLVKYISDFAEKTKSYELNSLIDFMQIHNETIITKVPNDFNNQKLYTPSNGEKSMLILNNALFKDANVYILDEPEMSVGHDYINNIIIPKIIELSKLNKIIIISTHDANIAVRTLPFTTIYRCEDVDMAKKTYIGNPFNDTMVDIFNDKNSVSWVETCINTLEGGTIALKERTATYGREKI